MKVLRSLGIEEEALFELEKLDFTKPIVFVDGEEPFKIHFMTFISGVEFDDAWSQKKTEDIEGIEISFIHLKHLVLSKRSTKRPKDKIDVEELQKIQALKHKK